MAKGQVSEEQLSKGLKTFGKPSALTRKPTRDNPFRDTREVVIEPGSAPVEATPAKAPIEPEPIAIAPEPPKPKANQMPELQGNTLVAATTPEPTHTSEALLQPKIEALPTQTKAQTYSEKVLLPLSSEMKEGLDSLARELHRTRPEKLERITANTLIRVAITTFLESYDKTPISSEEELLEVVRMQLGIR